MLREHPADSSILRRVTAARLSPPENPFTSNAGRLRYEDDSNAWAARLLAPLGEFLRKADPRTWVSPGHSSVLDRLRLRGEHTAARQRRLGRFDDARRTAAMMLTLGEELVRQRPADADSYKFLAEAYNQIAKNAYKVKGDNRAAVERSLASAVAAIRRASELAPQREDLLLYLSDKSVRLADLRAGMAQPFEADGSTSGRGSATPRPLSSRE